MKKNILKIGNFQSGMTYVELIVVLSIFSVMTSISVFNYGAFQNKVDARNLATDIAIKLVEAQKASVFGQLNSHNYINNWKPSYGLYFTLSANGLADNKSFNYFADLNNSTGYDDGSCSPSSLSGECLEKINLTKGSTIKTLVIYYQNGTSQSINDVTLLFTRPDSGAFFRSNAGLSGGINYLEITVQTQGSKEAKIRLYATGRVDVV